MNWMICWMFALDVAKMACSVQLHSKILIKQKQINIVMIAISFLFDGRRILYRQRECGGDVNTKK